jgi:hypothetical protein
VCYGNATAMFGVISGFGVAWVLISMLAGCSTPTETIAVPLGYLAVTVIGTGAVAAAVVFAFARDLTSPAALKPE